MYEVGKERLDGKFNIWKRAQVIPNHWDWIIVEVCYSQEEADNYALMRNRRRAK